MCAMSDAAGAVPTAVATLVATGALLLMRVTTLSEACGSVPWSIVILVGGMIPLPSAFVSSAAAELVAHIVLSALGTPSHQLALLVICGISMLLGQFMSNLATVLIMIPIATAVSQTTGATPQPFMMALAVCGAASFPDARRDRGNLIVVRAGGYNFAEYWKQGILLMVCYLAVAVLFVPLIWPY
jgi:di/tricarboxylate transporter